MLNVVFQRMEAGSTHVVVPPIVVSDVLGLPPADASNMSAFVQQFLADVVAAVDPFGTAAQEIQQARRACVLEWQGSPAAAPALPLGLRLPWAPAAASASPHRSPRLPHAPPLRRRGWTTRL